ncbi:MAG: hypothetical protein GF353_11840 [Candidatus Lokiarchaeota archaeon]|nr:hypothetical protein [Candidatus Lokiarchaeota archaeon]
MSYTKTIRFSKADKYIYDAWDRTLVKKIKKFLRSQVPHSHVIKHIIGNSNDPRGKKQQLLEEKLELIKYMMKNRASQKIINKLSKQYFEIKKIQA